MAREREEVKPEHVLALLALFGFGLLLAEREVKREEERVVEVRAPEVEIQPVPEQPPVEVVVPQPVPEQPPVALPTELPNWAVIDMRFTSDAQYPRTVRVHKLDATRPLYVDAYFATVRDKCINVNGYSLCGSGTLSNGTVVAEYKRMVIPSSSVITVRLEHELTDLERIDVQLYIPVTEIPLIDCKDYDCRIAREIDIL
jgi:hypothetical protein